MQTFKVKLDGKEIDKVFYGDNVKVTKEEVYKSLVDHDGYDSRIVIVKEKSKGA